MATSQAETDKADDTNKPESPAEEPEAAVEQQSDDVEEKAATTNETDESKHPISKTIQKMTESPDAPSDEAVSSTETENAPPDSSNTTLAICAKDIMQKDVVWGGPDDNVQQALEKIQQQDTGYMLIGNEGVPEGIVSKSDLAGGMSPYLRPEFAKWRRPVDDATLQIRLKWIMSRPVSTIKLETPLMEIMESMCRLSRRALPVVDNQGKVQGLITVFDIFKVLTENFCCK